MQHGPSPRVYISYLNFGAGRRTGSKVTLLSKRCYNWKVEGRKPQWGFVFLFVDLMRFSVSQAMGVPHVLAWGPRGSQCFLLLCLCCCCGDSYGLSRCKECGVYVMSLCVRRQTEVLIDQKRTKSVRQRETRPAEKAQQKQQREVWIVNTSRLKKLTWL